MTAIQFRNVISQLQKRFFSVSVVAPQSLPNSSLSSPLSFPVQYLVNSCGLSLESALATSTLLQLDENKCNRIDTLLDLLISHGFQKAQIANLISKRPFILRSNVEKNLRPKLEFFVKNGFKDKILPEIVVSNPTILLRSLSSQMKPSFEFLNQVLGNEQNIIAAVKRCSWLLTSNVKSIMQPNVDLLLSEGVPMDSISKILIKQPRTIILKVNRVAQMIKTLKKLGHDPSSPMFAHSVRAMASMNEASWERKVKVFKSLGWSEEDVLSAFKRNPLCLGCSEKKLRKSVDFLTNTMKLDLNSIISYPKILMHSVEKRFLPRYNVLNLLVSKNLLKRNKKLMWYLVKSEKVFLENYVIKYQDAIPGLLDIYFAAGSKS